MTSTLHDAVQKVLDRQGTSDLALDAVAELILEQFDAHKAVVYTLDKGTGMLKLRCHVGIDRSAVDAIRFLCMGKGLTGKAATERGPIQGWQHADSRCAGEKDVLPEGSLFVPMLAEDALRGVLGIAKDFHREYAPDEVAALSSIARLIAAYLN